MNATRWKLIIYLCGIFAAGGASGWFVASKNTVDKPKPPPGHEDIAKRIKKYFHDELKLTDDQQQRIDSIVDQSADEMKSLHMQHSKRIWELVNSRNQRILGVLNPDQQKRFLANEERRAQEFRERFRQRGGPRERDRSREGDRGEVRKDRGGDEKCETNKSEIKTGKELGTP